MDSPRLPIITPEQWDAFCRRWGITELSLFGSVLRRDFGPGSDVDVLVSFAPDSRASLWDWDEMTQELEALVGRRVDLVSRRAVERSPNWIRRESILGQAQVVHVRAAL